MSNYTENHIRKDQNHAWSKILKFIPDGSRILDIGCSSGNLGEFLATQKDCVVDGVEPDKKDATLASKKLRKVWNSDIETAVKNIHNKYDVLIFADVLEHLIYPDKVLQTVRNLLEPTGRVVFSVPNMAHVSVRLALLAGDWKYTETALLDKTHLHYWDIDTVKDVFKEADMNLVELDTVTYKYPKKLIQNRLNDIGFTANAEGVSLLTGREASTFQIIGFAEISKPMHNKITLPEPAFQKDIRYLAQDLTEQIKSLQQHEKSAEKYIQHLEHKIDEMNNSRSYKMALKISSLLRFVKR